MAVYVCAVCGYMYDEAVEGVPWAEVPDTWMCPVCGNGKEFYYASDDAEDSDGPSIASNSASVPESEPGVTAEMKPLGEAAEPHLTDIGIMAETAASIIEPMRTREPVISWDEVLVMGAQISRLPLNESDDVSVETTIGPSAAHPLVVQSPVIISHMSFGALSREAKVALARGSAAVGCAMSSGEGGILPEAMAASHRYIFEYVPNRYSVNEEYLTTVDAVEIKLGQSAKPGMGGHLPGSKVTDEVAKIRGFRPGADIISPAHHDDITNADDLRAKVDWLREATGGKPIGVKLAAGNLEDDLTAVISANPDFITVDGRAGATGAAPKYIKHATSVPTLFAVDRARAILDQCKSGASLIVTGGFRVSSDIAKAIALGADAVALGTSALMAIGCRQYRICHTGRCPMGIATQDPELRKNIDVDHAARRLENFLRVTVDELKTFSRLTGRSSVHEMDVLDLRTVNSEVSKNTRIKHV